MNSEEFIETHLAAEQLILEGRHAEAIEPLRRCRVFAPDDRAVSLNLFKSLLRVGELEEAEAMVEEMRRRWGTDQPVLVAIARLREAQHRLPEALELIRDLHINIAETSIAYPDYLRILVENERWDEAVIESLRGVRSPIAAKADPLLARIFSTLALDEPDMAMEAAEALARADRDAVIASWIRQVATSGALPIMRKLIEAGVAQRPQSAGLRSLLDRIAAADRTTSP
jgi:pentatricopeptide repeat protein